MWVEHDYGEVWGVRSGDGGQVPLEEVSNMQDLRWHGPGALEVLGYAPAGAYRHDPEAKACTKVGGACGRCRVARTPEFLWKKCEICSSVIATGRDHALCWSKHLKTHVVIAPDHGVKTMSKARCCADGCNREDVVPCVSCPHKACEQHPALVPGFPG